MPFWVGGLQLGDDRVEAAIAFVETIYKNRIADDFGKPFARFGFGDETTEKQIEIIIDQYVAKIKNEILNHAVEFLEMLILSF